MTLEKRINVSSAQSSFENNPSRKSIEIVVKKVELSRNLMSLSTNKYPLNYNGLKKEIMYADYNNCDLNNIF